MIRRALVLLATAALLACGKKPAPPPSAPVPTPPPPTVIEDTDSDNLLNLAYGASVVSRTGELTLDSSAIHAIDGSSYTFWLSPTGDLDKTIVYSLLSPARIHTIGVTSPSVAETPKRVRFEGSMDAKTWRELGSVAPQNREGRQLVPIPPAVARYVRVHIEPSNTLTRVHAFHAIGDEVEPPQTPPFSGCWTINGVRAHLEQNGARITGIIESNPPVLLDGGTDNRAAYVMWMEGPMWGTAALSRTVDGAHISGVRFYEGFDALNAGEAWLGDRCEESGVRQRQLPLSLGATLLERTGHYSAYGLAFDHDDHLLEALSRAALDTLPPAAKFVAYEHRFETPDENRKHAAARLASLRAVLQSRGVDVARMQFVAAGSQAGEPPVGSAVQRRLASRVDIIAAP